MVRDEADDLERTLDWPSFPTGVEDKDSGGTCGETQSGIDGVRMQQIDRVRCWESQMWRLGLGRPKAETRHENTHDQEPNCC
jgi:hypothetical protein